MQKKRSPRYLIMSGKQCQNCGRRSNFVVESTNEAGEKIWQCTAEDCKHVSHYYTLAQIDEIFTIPTKMTVYAWSGM